MNQIEISKNIANVGAILSFQVFFDNFITKNNFIDILSPKISAKMFLIY